MEIWKDIKGFEGSFQISNKGRIRSLDRWIDGRSRYFIHGRVLKTAINMNGYEICNIKIRNKGHNVYIHREVAKAFGKKENGKNYVNHIDGNKLNNTIENLEWCTASENNQHAYDIGLKLGPIGTKQWNSKLTEKEVIEIYRIAKSGKYSDPQVASMFGVKRLQVLKIRRGLRWGWLTKNIAI